MGRTARRLGLGFLFWLGFVLVLEPGNLVRATHAGLPFSWPGEALRLAGAGLLGAPTLPLLLWLSPRLPVRGPDALRNAVLLAAGIVLLAAALILTGSVVAGWMPPTSIRTGLGDQIAGNLLLLTAALGVLAAGAQLATRTKPADGASETPPLEQIAVKTRGGTLLLPMAEVDWVEAQGNYLALHAGPSTHLIRETLGRFETRLDQGRFVRVHRGAIVNLERVRQVRPLGNGDAVILLDTGAELRLSRNHRSALMDRL
jgi:hypothetical protein